MSEQDTYMIDIKEKFVLRSAILPLGPGFIPIMEQASLFGREVPVGKTAKDIRELGFKIDPSVPDDAILSEEPNSPTGLVFSFSGKEQLAVWALAL